jgi:hypothetical protein
MARLIHTTFDDIDSLTATVNELFDHGVPFRVNRDLLISCLESIPFLGEVTIQWFAYNKDEKSFHFVLNDKETRKMMEMELQIVDQELITSVKFDGKQKKTPYFLEEFTPEEFRSLWR